MARGEERLKLVLDAIDRTAAPIRKINRRIESMTKPIRKVKRAFSVLAREAGLGKLAAGVKRMARGVRNLGLAGAAAAAGLGAMTARVAGRGDEIAKFSRQIGISAESLQEYEFAASRAGVESAVFRSSVGALSKRVGELKAGKGALSTIIGGTDLARQLKGAQDTGEALEIINGAIAKIEDPTKKAALAAAAFSRAGLPMIRLANEGADGIAALRTEAQDLGLVLSEEDAKAAEAVTDAITNLKAAGEGLSNSLGVALFPALTSVADGLTEWVKVNRAWIQLGISEALAALAVAWDRVSSGFMAGFDAVSGVDKRAGGLGETLSELGAVVSEIFEKLGGWETVGAVVGGAVGLIVFALKNLISVLGWVSDLVDSILPSLSGFADIVSPVLAKVVGFGGQLFGGGPGETAPIAVGGGRADVGGRISIELEDNRARIREAETNSPALDLDLSGGEALALP